MIKRWPLPVWLRRTPEKENIVVSTRVRLARNLNNLRFPLLASAEEQENLRLQVAALLAGPELKSGLAVYPLAMLPVLERRLLAERGLIGMESVDEPKHAALAIGPSQTVSVLINEEDHFRIQVIQAGLDFNTPLAMARNLDQQLERNLPVARHPEFGYLTACPTNVGTGLRLSAMLHLPGLALTRGIVQVMQAILHMGLAVRGLYGEGTEMRSVFFQVSNQITLGRSEAEIAQHLNGVLQQVIERELEARQKLLKEEGLLLADKVMRARGILQSCRLLGLEEGLELLSTIRLGMDLELLPAIPRALFNEIWLHSQTAHLQRLVKKTLTADKQAAWRAEYIRRKLFGRKPKL